MKDLYSFDRDQEGLDVSYTKMHHAYTRIFQRCGLSFRPVEADPGAIGGSDTHEFMVLADSGEAAVLFCGNSACDYASNAEKAGQVFKAEKAEEEIKPLSVKDTPNVRTVDQVSIFLKIPPQKIIKTILYESEHGVIAALVRGDRDINEIKLLNALGYLRLDLAGENTVKKTTGAAVGFAGPVGLKGVKIIADLEVAALVNAVVGANKDDVHNINVNPGRDFTIDLLTDIRMVQAGEPCPSCGGVLKEARGIEVGQIFKLGDKYSKILGATYSDENGLSKTIIMGCYGIGVTRTMAAAVEQNHDQDGIIWPASIAPFQTVIIPVNTRDISQVDLAENIYGRLSSGGVDTVLDDRAERAGVKFKDADLIGYPLRITIGSKAVAEKQVEVRARRTGEITVVPLDKIEFVVRELLSKL